MGILLYSIFQLVAILDSGTLSLLLIPFKLKELPPKTLFIYLTNVKKVNTLTLEKLQNFIHSSKSYKYIFKLLSRSAVLVKNLKLFLFFNVLLIY